MKKYIFKRAGLFLCIAMVSVRVAAELPVQMDPGHPAILYTGRFTDDYRFGWSGSRIETELEGSSISAVLELVSGKTAAITAVVDGQEKTLILNAGQKIYPLAEELEVGKRHRVVLFKRSEGSIGTVKFGGFLLPDGGELFKVAAPERRILVIGDSITCGYGNEAKTVEEGNTVENENGYRSYAAIAARDLNAGLMMICWSGRGMYRNRQVLNDTVDTIPKIFDRTLPAEAGLPWDHSRFIPDVVVINLGTNDMSTQGGKPPLGKDDYIAAYTAFLSRIRSLYPEAKIILSSGPMAYKPVSDWLPEIAAQFEGASTLLYAPLSGAEDRGGHWHPSVKKDKAMAAELTAHIKTRTDWK
jgi:lysophospholipase L1-like esterase